MVWPPHTYRVWPCQAWQEYSCTVWSIIGLRHCMTQRTSRSHFTSFKKIQIRAAKTDPLLSSLMQWALGKEIFHASSYRKKMEEREQWVRKEKEWTRCKEDEDAKLRERRGGMVIWSLMLGVIGEELAPWGGWQQYCNCGSSYTNGEGGGTDGELADCWHVAERDKKDRDDAEERGGQSPARHGGIQIAGVMRGDDDAGIRNL
jgi:hypothetical protein